MTLSRLRQIRGEGAETAADSVGIESAAVGVTIASGRDIEEMSRQMYVDRFDRYGQ